MISTDRFVVIPPMSEALFPIVTSIKLKTQDFGVNGDLQLFCRTLQVARPLVKGAEACCLAEL